MTFNADLLWFEPSIESRSRSHKYHSDTARWKASKSPWFLRSKQPVWDGRRRRRRVMGVLQLCHLPGGFDLCTTDVFCRFYVIIHHWKSTLKDLKGSESSSSVWDSTPLFLLSYFWPTQSESNQLVFLNFLHLLTWQGSSKMTNPNNFTGHPSKLPYI